MALLVGQDAGLYRQTRGLPEARLRPIGGSYFFADAKSRSKAKATGRDNVPTSWHPTRIWPPAPKRGESCESDQRSAKTSPTIARQEPLVQRPIPGVTPLGADVRGVPDTPDVNLLRSTKEIYYRSQEVVVLILG